MGRVRVAGLDFSIDYLRSEVAAFQDLMTRDGWMVQGNLESRQAAMRGLIFVMLNLSCDANQDEAWKLFHQVMDSYYALCDRQHLRY